MINFAIYHSLLQRGLELFCAKYTQKISLYDAFLYQNFGKTYKKQAFSLQIHEN